MRFFVSSCELFVEDGISVTFTVVLNSSSHHPCTFTKYVHFFVTINLNAPLLPNKDQTLVNLNSCVCLISISNLSSGKTSGSRRSVARLASTLDDKPMSCMLGFGVVEDRIGRGGECSRPSTFTEIVDVCSPLSHFTKYVHVFVTQNENSPSRILGVQIFV